MTFNLAYLLVDKSRLVRKRFDEGVRDLELTGPQARLLLLVERKPGERQTSYADNLEIEPITLCRMVDRLEERGWLVRTSDPDDRRAWLLQPTDKSRDIKGRLRDIIDTVLDEILTRLEHEEREELGRLLTKIGEPNISDATRETVDG